MMLPLQAVLIVIISHQVAWVGLKLSDETLVALYSSEVINNKPYTLFMHMYMQKTFDESVMLKTVLKQHANIEHVMQFFMYSLN